MEPGPDDVSRRLERMEATLLEVVTALGMLVGELALQDTLVLTKAVEVEDALEKGWAALFGSAVDRSDLREPAPAALTPGSGSGALTVEVEPALGSAQLLDVAGPAFVRALYDAGASVGALYEVVDGRELVLVESAGYPTEVIGQFERFSLDADLPVAEVARSGRPVWFDERRAILETYPELKDAHEQTEAAIGAEGVQGAVIPLQVGGDMQLVLLFGFVTGDLQPTERRDLTDLGTRFAKRLTEVF